MDIDDYLAAHPELVECEPWDLDDTSDDEIDLVDETGLSEGTAYEWADGRVMLDDGTSRLFFEAAE